MCSDHGRHPAATEQPPHVFGTPAAAAAPTTTSTTARTPPGQRLPVALPPPGSRRRRLWELDDHAHCPVIGTCLPLALLRRLLARHASDHARGSDYELHCVAVTAGKSRNVLAEALHKELDRRYALVVQRAAAIRSTEGLAQWWHDGVGGADLPGTLWATLTHPRCDAALAQRVLGEVHMLQHQVGAAQRVEVARLDSLVLEHAAMARELAAAQERCRRLGADAARRADDLEADRMRLRAQLIGRDSQLADLRAQLAAQEAAAPGLRERLELTRSVQQLTERNQDLQRALARARDDADQQRQRAERLQAQLQEAQGAPGAPTPTTAPAPSPSLAQRAVLCVGGRAASVPVYRQVVERSGGRFLHHDGGDEDSSARLDDTLGAADLVVCQTGCISHGAYWRVKDHCKRTGTPCLFVETPSRSALERALQEAAAATATSRGA